jgi:hypothetical protein
MWERISKVFEKSNLLEIKLGLGGLLLPPKLY